MLRIGVIMYQTSLTKGQELVAQRMVKEFRRQGHDAFLITSIFHDGEPAGLTSEDVKKRGGYVQVFDRVLEIPVIRISSDGATWPPRRISFEDFIGILTKIVDELNLNVLITHSTLWNGPEEAVKFMRWRRKMISGGAPYHHLVFGHMSHFQEPSDERYAIQERSYRETWNGSVLRQIMDVADVVLVTTSNEGDYMRKNLGLSNDKLMFFPGGIEDEAMMSMGDAGAFKAQHKLDGGKKIVAYLGTVEERKNPLAILEVAKILSKKRPDIHFVLAGRLEGEYGANVKEAASKLDNVTVLGAVSEQDKVSLIKSSFVNVVMSRSEALGISQLEFMSMGVPVITSGVGGQSWIVRDGFNGVILKGPDDVQGAADAIARLAGSPSQRKKRGKNAARFASGFSITRLVGALSKRLESELQRRPDGVPSSLQVSGEERLMEAWAYDGHSVAATSSRLIIRSAAKKGRNAIIVPYNEIAKVVRHIKAPWPILGIGISLTAVLLLQRMVWSDPFSSFIGPEISAALSAVGIPGLTSGIVSILPLVPLFVSVAAFTLMLKEGFLVHYGPAKSRVFLPKRFVKALKVADKLTPKDPLVVED
jgi:D-inositol-3-phosphate glycosyltransferase